jgi:hypothetical protein
VICMTATRSRVQQCRFILLPSVEACFLFCLLSLPTTVFTLDDLGMRHKFRLKSQHRERMNYISGTVLVPYGQKTHRAPHLIPLRAYSISAVHPAAPDTVPFPVSDSPVDSAAEKEASCLCLGDFVLHGNGLRNGAASASANFPAQDRLRQEFLLNRSDPAFRVGFRFGLLGGKARVFTPPAWITWRNDGQYLLSRS